MFNLEQLNKDSAYLALYDNHEPFDIGAKIIKLATKSSFSHCELIINGYSYSSSIPDKGVRYKALVDVYKHPENWTLIELPWLNKNRVSKIIEFYDMTADDPYGWGGLILGQLFNIRIDARGYLCSEWVIAAIYYSLGITVNAQQYSPEDVRSYCLSMNAK